MYRQGLNYLAALACVLAGIGVAWVLQRLPLANLSLVFLTVVIIVAARWGAGPALFAGFISFLSYNFFFTAPYFTFRVQNRGDVATLLFFLAMAALTGNLAARMRREIRDRQAALSRMSELFDFSRTIASATDAEAVLDALCEHLHQIIKRPVTAALPDGSGGYTIRVGAEEPVPADLFGLSATVAAGTTVHRTDGWIVIPLQAARGAIAIHGDIAVAGQLDLVASLCRHAEVALERTLLAKDLAEARISSNTEQLRSALLSSVSHDLRTPLASIIGSASSLIEYGDAFSGDNRRRLLHAILAESRRLDRYIQNLLDMTRLGQGKVSMRRDWVDFRDIVTAARERLGSTLDGFELDVTVDGDVALLYVHGALLEQVLVNLLDNAARYSPPKAKIGIHSRREGDELVIDVTDRGPGIAPELRERVFEMFFRGNQPDGAVQGTGLGLAICRGLIGAHGGRIEALAGAGESGTCIRITLPSITFEHPHGESA